MVFIFFLKLVWIRIVLFLKNLYHLTRFGDEPVSLLVSHYGDEPVFILISHFDYEPVFILVPRLVFELVLFCLKLVSFFIRKIRTRLFLLSKKSYGSSFFEKLVSFFLWRTRIHIPNFIIVNSSSKHARKHCRLPLILKLTESTNSLPSQCTIIKYNTIKHFRKNSNPSKKEDHSYQ